MEERRQNNYNVNYEGMVRTVLDELSISDGEAIDFIVKEIGRLTQKTHNPRKGVKEGEDQQQKKKRAESLTYQFRDLRREYADLVFNMYPKEDINRMVLKCLEDKDYKISMEIGKLAFESNILPDDFTNAYEKLKEEFKKAYKAHNPRKDLEGFVKNFFKSYIEAFVKQRKKVDYFSRVLGAQYHIEKQINEYLKHKGF